MNDQADGVGQAGAADLLAAAGALDSDATRLDQVVPAGDPAAGKPGAALSPGAPAPVDFTADAGELVDFAGELFFPMWPRLAAVWTPEKKTQLKARLAPVLKKHNLSLERILGQWGAEIMLAAALVPAVVPTYQAIRADNQDAIAKAKADAAVPNRPTTAAPVQQPAAPPPPPPGQPSAAPPDPLKLHQEGNPNLAAAAPDDLKLHTRA